MKLSAIQPNKDNPRIIKDDRFQKLVQSIHDFPAMMELRPIVVNSKMMILGVNMRYRALLELGMKEVPDSWVKIAEGLTKEEQRRFVIEDNIPFGEWDADRLKTEWDTVQLSEWGLDIEKDDRHTIQSKELRPYKKTHVLLSFPPEKILDIQDSLDKILNTEGVEYEQSSN